jgi:2-keto-3-deoxy-L-rhamnonate aldolase RhmA
MNKLLWEDYKGVRRFRNPDIQEQIDRVVAKLDREGKTLGVIAHTDDTGKWKVTGVVRFGDNFSIHAAVYDNYKTPEKLSFEAEAVFAI